jgi:hypothetical protein
MGSRVSLLDDNIKETIEEKLYVNNLLVSVLNLVQCVSIVHLGTQPLACDTFPLWNVLLLSAIVTALIFRATHPHPCNTFEKRLEMLRETWWILIFVTVANAVTIAFVSYHPWPGLDAFIAMFQTWMSIIFVSQALLIFVLYLLEETLHAKHRISVKPD